VTEPHTPPGASGAERPPDIPIAVLANPGDASLAGGHGAGGPVVALGDVSAAERPAVRWLDRAPRDGDYSAERVIAPAGDGLWRVAPWPAADELFELPAPTDGAILVTGAESDLRETIVAGASARGVPVATVEHLDAERLSTATAVVVAESPQGALPARAFAVLAARRLLLVPRLDRTFGLEDGLDHLEFAGPDEAVTLLDAYVRSPTAFARVLAWGRLKAEPRRASAVYARLAADLRLDGIA
jgi:hypothetical protein